MGGGAGVRFTFRVESFFFTVARGKLKPVAPVKIKDWDCVGYMDGMCNVRGDMLTVKNVYYALTPDDKKELKEHGAEPTDKLYCSKFEVERLEWAGFVRGKWQNVFPMHLKARADLEFIGEVEMDVEVEIVDRAQFAEFWKDAFGFIVTDEDLTDDTGERYTLEDVYQMHDDDNRVNYGAPR